MARGVELGRGIEAVQDGCGGGSGVSARGKRGKEGECVVVVLAVVVTGCVGGCWSCVVVAGGWDSFAWIGKARG